jgi:Arc/MetJ-type ribon-helix-helix transcriptional regulator
MKMNKNEKMKIMTINVPLYYFEKLDWLIAKGLYPSRSEILRVAIQRMFEHELNFIEHLEKEFERENPPNPMSKTQIDENIVHLEKEFERENPPNPMSKTQIDENIVHFADGTTKKIIKK